MIDRPDQLAMALADLVQAAGGQRDAVQMQDALTSAMAAAAEPVGPRDLTVHEILRIRLTKAVARATPPAVYRERAERQRLRRAVSDLLVAHGVARDAPRLPGERFTPAS